MSINLGGSLGTQRNYKYMVIRNNKDVMGRLRILKWWVV